MCGPLNSPALATAGNSLDDTIECALRAVAKRHGLSATLEERLLEIARGLSYRDIAFLHDLSENTIKNEARYLLDILGLDCRHLIDSAVRAASARSGAPRRWTPWSGTSASASSSGPPMRTGGTLKRPVAANAQHICVVSFRNNL